MILIPFVTLKPFSGQFIPLWCVIFKIKPLNSKLNLICHLLALLGAHHIFHVSRIRVNTPIAVNHNKIY
jgi:hypothetical protein